MSAKVRFWLTNILPFNKYFTLANINPNKLTFGVENSVDITKSPTKFKTAINIYSLNSFLLQ